MQTQTLHHTVIKEISHYVCIGSHLSRSQLSKDRSLCAAGLVEVFLKDVSLGFLENTSLKAAIFSGSCTYLTVLKGVSAFSFSSTQTKTGQTTPPTSLPTTLNQVISMLTVHKLCLQLVWNWRSLPVSKRNNFRKKVNKSGCTQRSNLGWLATTLLSLCIIIVCFLDLLLRLFTWPSATAWATSRPIASALRLCHKTQIV